MASWTGPRSSEHQGLYRHIVDGKRAWYLDAAERLEIEPMKAVTPDDPLQVQVWELPAAIRRGLPQFSTVLVFSDDRVVFAEADEETDDAAIGDPATRRGPHR